MKKKQVELTQEQCQEIIDQMTTRSFYRSDKGNSSDMENLQTMESVGSSIDDILPGASTVSSKTSPNGSSVFRCRCG